jgi:hypothetical protein
MTIEPIDQRKPAIAAVSVKCVNATRRSKEPENRTAIHSVRTREMNSELETGKLAERGEPESNVLSQDFALIRVSTPSAIFPASIGTPDPFIRESADKGFVAFPFLARSKASNRVDLG